MASPWGPIGDAANIAGLVGLDVVNFIRLIMEAARKARMHKTKCQEFADDVQMIWAIIDQLDLLELNINPTTREPLQRLEDALRRSYHLVRSCQYRSFPHLIITAWKIDQQFRTLQAEIDHYLRLLPLANFAVLHELIREIRGLTRRDQPQDSTYGDPVQNAPSSSGRSGRETNRNHGSLHRIFKSRKSLKDQISVESEQAEVSQEGQPRNFRFQELWKATNHFSEDNIIGSGEFTTVYRGTVDKMPVAVKIWESYADGLQEWEKEKSVLSNMRHPNLIKLLGSCNEDDKIILVYELMNNGDLEQFLNRGRGGEPLSWEQRIKIATGAARGLAFLHTPENNIIHRVIKPSVILLDGEFNVKLSGLGCSREGPIDGATGVTTQLMGAAGYVDPVYAMTGHLDAKADVYAFGIIMLQLLSGLKVFDRSRPKKQHLVSYAHDIITDKEKLREFMDPTLGKQYRLKHAFKLAKLCQLCVSYEGSLRPQMKTILEELESICPGQVEAGPVILASE